MFIDLKKTLVLLGSSSLLFTGCGDDGDGNSTPDAAVEFDAAVEEPDAAPPDPTFSGTLSLAEVEVTNPEAAVVGGISGGVANISFTDPADVTVAPQEGYENNIGACRIFVYDVAGGEEEPGGSDAGAVSVSDSANGPFACAYTAAIDTYVCSSTDAAAAGTMPSGNVATGTTLSPNVAAANGTADLRIPGADFSGATYKGMSIVLSGFNEAAANGRFPIVGEPETDTLTIFNPELGAIATLDADSTYQTLVGAGPVPLGGAEFLDDGTTEVTLTKAEATNAPAVDTALTANGEGFALEDGVSAVPHEVPTTGDPVTFSCADSCGVAGTGFLKGIIVFGSTTDADLTGTAFNDMPDPVTSFASFQCSGIGAESITLDAGAMALILGTNPTRIQTSVTYANAEIAGKNNIVLSHGVVGFTDVEP